MKITLVVVMSTDGKITKWDRSEVYSWTSAEDKSYFSSLIRKSKVLIMGRKTFDTARDSIKLSPAMLRIVVTKNPKKYAGATVPRQLEFTNDNPLALVKKLKARGFKEALLLGGGEINSLYIRSKLINEIWLTVEPVILGSGKDLISKGKFNVDLQLQSVKKLNKKGTILLKYKVK